MALSECCQAPPLGEVIDEFGICSACRDHARFNPDCPECGGDDTSPKSDLTDTHWICADCGHEWDTYLTNNQPMRSRPSSSDPTLDGHALDSVD